MATVIVNGPVLEKEVRSGQNDRGPWSFTTAKILTGKADVAEVRFGSDYAEDLPREGEYVSLLVEATVYNRPGSAGRLSLDVKRSTTADERLAEPAALAGV